MMATLSTSTQDVAFLPLTRLLSRLSQAILSPGPEQTRLETSSLERKRVGTVWKLEAIPSN